MANIELVVKVPEEYYEQIKNTPVWWSGMKNCILNGKPLPKGHGRLIDADELFDKIQFADFSSSDDVNIALFSIGYASTIIEADKEG